ncbi:MAG: response regulator transcription factor [Chromatiales bacterium]|nr:response regulator transcription factor [Chromatiales bacterium]
MRIAILEDDLDQANLLKLWLEGSGHIAHIFTESEALQKEMRRGSFDQLILDWELPVSSGLEVLKWVRSNSDWDVPVLFTTVRDTEEDIVTALEAGADDYMVKPLSKAVTLARVHALGRRARTGKQSEEKRFTIAGFTFDLKESSISQNDTPIDLTEREFKLAIMLFNNIGRLISRDHLLETVWGISTQVATRTVDTHVSRLRQKLGLVPENGWHLKAVYQHGYRLEQLDDSQAA